MHMGTGGDRIRRLPDDFAVLENWLAFPDRAQREFVAEGNIRLETDGALRFAGELDRVASRCRVDQRRHIVFGTEHYRPRHRELHKYSSRGVK